MRTGDHPRLSHPIFAPMENEDLVRRLRRFRRIVDLLQTDLRYGHVNEKLLTDIESHLEHGIGTDPRCHQLVTAVDVVRESTFTPRAELMADTIRACDKLKDAIEGVVSRVR